MGQRLKGLAEGTDWTAGFRQVPDLLLRASEATASGYRALGAGFGGGIATRRERQHREGIEERNWQMQLRQEGRMDEREKRDDARARLAMGLTLWQSMAGKVATEKTRLQQGIASGDFDPESPEVKSALQKLGAEEARAGAMQNALMQAGGYFMESDGKVKQQEKAEAG